MAQLTANRRHHPALAAAPRWARPRVWRVGRIKLSTLDAGSRPGSAGQIDNLPVDPNLRGGVGQHSPTGHRADYAPSAR